MKHKYGGTQRGIFALEPIKAGERIWYCECGDKDETFTRDQLLDIIYKYPRLDYFVRSFSYMIDDDLYALPITFMDEKNNDECALFNHSCDRNIGFADEAFGDNIIACRNIEPGEELTYHYGFLETEASLIYGIECKCGLKTCCRQMTFDYYRDPAFVNKYFAFMTPYLKKKAIDMNERWYSTKCYVKRFPVESLSEETGSNSSGSDLEGSEKGLVSLKQMKKGELVAIFNGIVDEKGHYLRHSIEPNCDVIGNKVFANCDIPSESELTIYYHGILL